MQISNLIINRNMIIEYGIDLAIMHSIIGKCIEIDKSNKSNKKENRWWTKCPLKRLLEISPWWSKSKIQYLISLLIQNGFVLKARHNEHKYDRTNWYAFTDKNKKGTK